MHKLQQQDLMRYTSCQFEDISWPLSISQTGFTWTRNSDSLALAMAKKYVLQANDNPNIGAIICPVKMSRFSKKPRIISDDAESIFFDLHNTIQNSPYSHRVDDTAQISPLAYIEHGVIIGRNVIIEAGCYVAGGSIIKDNVYLGPKVMIGTEGMFPKNIFGRKSRIKHLGGVLIDDNCVIHAGANVSRALHYNNNTTIGHSTHIGIQTDIAHDVIIGHECEISAHSIIAGRAIIGNHVWIGANVTVSNWIKVGDHASIKLGSTVINDVDPQKTVSGPFAIDHSKNLFSHAGKIKDN